ncbi:HEAT repeat domain-containing protein [Kribbella sp. NPDC054772]
MTSFNERLVLKQQPVTRTVLSQVTWDHDWDLVDVGRIGDDPYVDVWRTEDGAVEIHYVEDGLVGLSYVTLYGDDVATARGQIEAGCALWSPADALVAEQTAESRDDRLRAIYAAALSATGAPQTELVEAFRALARTDDDAGIRQAIVVATGYLPWPELVDLVRELGRDDPTDHVRHNAAVLLEGLRA